MDEWILVATDGSEPAAAAVTWAADQAVLWRRGLRIVHVAGPAGLSAPFGDIAGLAEIMSREGLDILQAAAEAARQRAPGVEVSTRALAGAVVPLLIKESEGASETVVGSRGRGGFTGLLLGSVSLGIAGHASGPVVVVREPPAPPRGVVVVGFDLSPHSEISLGYAMEQARVRGATVRAVHAWQLPVSPTMAEYPDLTNEAMAAELRAAGEALVPWRERYPRVPIEEVLVPGHPVPAIARAAADADLVVVGSRGLGGLRSAVLGSVGNGVLHGVTAPVAVVR
ncbi:universal stress protein [Streptosporangium sp. KLBMP 9127]|nr:universal stress protein [Streptosporangium sp. KLBMP 9127]